MARPWSQGDRQRRLFHLAQEWGLPFDSSVGPASPALRAPGPPPTFRTPSDAAYAEDMLRLRRTTMATNGRLYKLKSKNWDPAFVFSMLEEVVANSGSPAVAESLIHILLGVGGDVNTIRPIKNGIRLRMHHSVSGSDGDGPTRGRLLERAVENQHLDMVQLLAPHCDATARNQALPIALVTRHAPIIKLLLCYGADLSKVDDGKLAFFDLSSDDEDSDLVRLVLQSRVQPTSDMASQAIVHATKAGSRLNVMQLSRSVGDCNFNKCEALKIAVSRTRVDLALAIVMGRSPPQHPGLDEAFDVLRLTPMSEQDSRSLAEVLLLAGAQGDCVNASLIKYAEGGMLDVTSLLIEFGASVESQKGRALRYAISHLDMDLLRIMLGGSSSIAPSYASKCLDLIPRDIPCHYRHELLGMLLRKGATGSSLDDALIDAVEAGDAESVELLMNPKAPLPSGLRGGVISPTSAAYHEIPSVNSKNGTALQIAVSKAEVRIIKALLSGFPTMETLSFAFPITASLASTERYDIIEAFLSCGIRGPPVDALLHIVIAEALPDRDDRLIQLLLEHGADVNFDNGEGLSAVISQGDSALLRTLLPSVQPELAQTFLADVLNVENCEVNLEIVQLLLEHCDCDCASVTSSAIVRVVQRKPVNITLLDLLLKKGNADVNQFDGDVMAQGLRDSDPAVIDTLIRFGQPTRDLCSRMLIELSRLPYDDVKMKKYTALLHIRHSKETLSKILVMETKDAVQRNDPISNFPIIQSLVDTGASVNYDDGSALCLAISRSYEQLVDLLLADRPTAHTLACALPYALAIDDPMDRVTFVKKVVDGGAVGTAANDLLIERIQTAPNDVPVLDTLASGAADPDGKALLAAIASESLDIVNVLLRRTKPPQNALDQALSRVMQVQDRSIRLELATLLTSAGVSIRIVSDKILTAIQDDDCPLAQLLVDHGGDPEHNDGAAIVESCGKGSVKMLKLLLNSKPSFDLDILNRAFAASSEVMGKNIKAALFNQLLSHGMKGEAVDRQLALAVTEGPKAEGLIRLLLRGGADPNYNNGEAIWDATANERPELLTVMLGLTGPDARLVAKTPTQATFLHSLEAAWDMDREYRNRVVTHLVAAGLTASEQLHNLLNLAVNEPKPDATLVKLLIKAGASPLVYECKTLLDIAQTHNAALLSLLLERDVPEADLAWVFTQTFARERIEEWFLEAGLRTAQVLLAKGASGYGLNDVLVAVAGIADEKSFDLADQFIGSLLERGADPNYEDGAALCAVASKAIAPWVRDFIQHKVTAPSVSKALAHVFDDPFDEEAGALELLRPFSNWCQHGHRIDFDLVAKECRNSLLARALELYPQSTLIIQMLLDIGCDATVMVRCRIDQMVQDEEDVSLLLRALAPPACQVPISVVKTLIAARINVNSASSLSRITGLMLAIQAGRQDIVKVLLDAGALVDVRDSMHRSPITYAARLTGNTVPTIISDLLTAGAENDDGSLHDAARELNFSVVQALMRHGHSPDFPSPLHGGRSALGELCLHATDAGQLSPVREISMERVIKCLVDGGSDVLLRVGGKSVLFLALDATDPVVTTRLLLKAGLWRHLNAPENRYSDGKHTYSATMYVSRLLNASPATDNLLALLRGSRGADIFFANSGPQPAHAVGLPRHMETAEEERRLRKDRLVVEDEDYQRNLTRSRELAAARRQLWLDQTKLEDQRRRMHTPSQLSARPQLSPEAPSSLPLSSPRSVEQQRRYGRLSEPQTPTAPAQRAIGTMEMAGTHQDVDPLLACPLLEKREDPNPDELGSDVDNSSLAHDGTDGSSDVSAGDSPDGEDDEDDDMYEGGTSHHGEDGEADEDEDAPSPSLNHGPPGPPRSTGGAGGQRGYGSAGRGTPARPVRWTNRGPVAGNPSASSRKSTVPFLNAWNRWWMKTTTAPPPAYAYPPPHASRAGQQQPPTSMRPDAHLDLGFGGPTPGPATAMGRERGWVPRGPAAMARNPGRMRGGGGFDRAFA